MVHPAALPAIAGMLAQSAIAPPPAEAPAGASRSPAQAEAQALDNADSPAEVLELQKERNERLTLPVTIEGKGPFRFVIDTGSQATVITHQINETLGLAPFANASLVAMASRRPVPLVRIATLKFGSRTIRDLVSPVLDRGNLGADGIIGVDSLQGLRVLMDIREKTIAVEDASENRDQRRGFEIVVRARRQLGQLLITNAKIEGVRATVIIDTGAQGSLGNLALRDRLRSKREEEVTTTDVNGVSMIGQMSVVRSLSIEGMALRNVPISFADSPAFEALGLADEPVIALGMQHLRLFDRVAIDFSRRQVMFDVPREVARAMRRLRSSGTRLPIR